jgi:hypothetical protein
MSNFEIQTPNNGRMVHVAKANTMEEAVEIMNSQQSLLDAIGEMATAVVFRIKDHVMVADGLMGIISHHYNDILKQTKTPEYAF